jgi:hypothetical protein
MVIDDPVKPYRLRVGVAYRVVEIEGELVVRKTSTTSRVGNVDTHQNQLSARSDDAYKAPSCLLLPKRFAS